MMKKIGLLQVFLLLLIAFAQAQSAEQTSFRDAVINIANDSKGKVEVAIVNIEDRRSFSYNGDARLVMHSVFKFPIAVTVLHLIDEGKFKLNQQIHISKSDLPETYSPLRDKYPEGNVNVTIGELLSYAVSLSDNDACDILLSKVTSKTEVEQYLHRIGVKDIQIHATESEMAANWETQYTNWASPLALIHLLDITWKNDVLTKKSHDFLWKIMYDTSTGPKRIKGLLPAGTMVAHKTGTSPTNAAGLSPGTNDIGIINLPNGKHLAIAILVGDAKVDMVKRELVIAKIAKLAYDHYLK